VLLQQSPARSIPHPREETGEDFDVLELQHVPHEGNLAVDALSVKASTRSKDGC
jgi:hypothetical protein